jgi:class 3 adenylate cyclase/pimeloyl-ACP methyl ester carboxylesterase
MEIPDVRYARSGDVAIAYQVVGDDPVDIVFVRGFAGDLLSTWDQPLLVRHVLDLAGFARVLMIDKRGQGLSDRLREVPTLEMRMDDLRAVMDDVDSRRAVLWSAHEGARLAALFAATYPERTAGLVLFDPEAKGTQAADYPWARSEEEWDRWLVEVREGWGRREFFERLIREWAPGVEDTAFRDWFVSHMRRSLSPGAAVAFFRAMRHADASDVFSAVRVPTVVLYSPSRREESAYTASRIDDASLVELPGQRGAYSWIEDRPHEVAIRETKQLVARLQAPKEEPERVLATVLFTDIAGSTAHAAQLGDRNWRELLARHHALVRRELGRFRGDEIDAVGDGFFATFDGPARAIRCACAIRDAVRELRLEVRAGVHTGECELVDGKVGGIAVHTGARVAGRAEPGEVLVSSTVKDLVAGSGLGFDDRGIHELKGVPGEWRLYAVTQV